MFQADELDETVSVLIASNRLDTYLLECLESSVKGLEKVQGELLLILDGVDLKSALDFLLPKFPHNQFTLSRSPGVGLVDALNHGLELAKGELIARMDADDIMHPDRLKLQCDRFRQDRQLVLLGGAIHLIDENGVEIRHIPYPMGDRNLRKMLRVGCFFAHPATMYRKSAVMALGGYRSKYPHAEDYDLWMRLSQVGKIDNLSDTLIYYRSHANQISNRFRLEQEESTNSILKEFGKSETGYLSSLDFRKVTRRLNSKLVSAAIKNPNSSSLLRRTLRLLNNPILTLRLVIRWLQTSLRRR